MLAMANTEVSPLQADQTIEIPPPKAPVLYFKCKCGLKVRENDREDHSEVCFSREFFCPAEAGFRSFWASRLARDPDDPSFPLPNLKNAFFANADVVGGSAANSLVSLAAKAVRIKCPKENWDILPNELVLLVRMTCPIFSNRSELSRHLNPVDCAHFSLYDQGFEESPAIQVDVPSASHTDNLTSTPLSQVELQSLETSTMVLEESSLEYLQRPRLPSVTQSSVANSQSRFVHDDHEQYPRKPLENFVTVNPVRVPENSTLYNQSHTCPLCDVLFLSWDSLQGHMENHNGLPSSSSLSLGDSSILVATSRRASSTSNPAEVTARCPNCLTQIRIESAMMGGKQGDPTCRSCSEKQSSWTQGFPLPGLPYQGESDAWLRARWDNMAISEPNEGTQ